MHPTIVLCLALPLALAGAACSQGPAPAQAPAAAPTGDYLMGTVRYLCQQRKTIVADYYDGKGSVAPNGMPIPGGRVTLSLSDGRRLALPQTVSGSGTRYANAGDSVVFWSKGDTAFLQEGANQTYADCVAQKG